MFYEAMIEQTLSFIKAAKTAKGFADWLESTGPAGLLSEIALGAAVASFSNLNVAVDQRSQLWSAVSQLEISFQSALRVAKEESTSWKNARMAHKITRRELANRCELILCLLSLCYKLLGEDQLALKYINYTAGLDAIKYGSDLGGKEIVLFPFWIVTALPQLWLDVATKSERVYITQDAYLEVRKIIATGWQD